MNRNEEIKKVSKLLYDEYISEGWKNVSLEGCERQAINYIDVKNRVEKSTTHNIKHTLIGWEQYKKTNWYESDSIDVEKLLMSQFLKIYTNL